MEQIRIICPHCHFSRDLPREKAPSQPVTATCPRCKGRFLLDPAAAPVVAPPRQEEPAAGTLPAAPPPRPVPRQNAPPRPTPRPPRPAPSSPARGAELRGIGELLTDAWTLFQSRFGTLFGIYLLFILATVLPPALCGGVGFALASLLPSVKGVVVGLSIALGAVAGIAGFSWGWGALVAASLDEKLDLRGAFARGGEKLLPFALVSFLVGFVITGGFLLFLIPGIIFSVWFFFAYFVIFDDDTRGMSALLKSRAYVSGRWFDVFLRLIVIWACSALLGAIPLVGPLLALVAVPYFMVYQALLFRDLKQASGPLVYSCGFADSARWVGIAALGYVVVPALLLAIFGATLYRSLAPFVGNGMPSLSIPSKQGESGSTGDFRVIPIPPAGGAAAEGGTPSGPPDASAPAGASQAMPQQEGARHPEHIHIFIYAVNYSGTVQANGSSIQELGTKPDMQYNYNMGGEKLVFGRNSITVDYAPLRDAGATMKPRIHLKVSYWKGNDKQVLGDWEIQETEAGQKSFDLDVPESLKAP